MRLKPLMIMWITAVAATWVSAGQKPQELACVSCHESAVDSFAHNVHARVAAFETPGGVTGCASCHGNVLEHQESGDPALVHRFGKDREADSRVCLQCHGRGSKVDFAGSLHAEEASCSSCHKVHGRSKATDTCASCHADVKSQLLAPSHHPIREGGMTCASCHDVHSSRPAMLAVEGRVNDLCVTCHAEKEGPFIFQHDPVEEDCMICHQPHGSTADNLLVANEPFLCMQCHEFHFHVGQKARSEAPTYTVGGKVYRNVLGVHGYRQAFSTKCTQCHTQIHGSDYPSQGISSRGKSLTR
ncbi:MAG: GSU2203 family decaheme c-type cytochrome [Thermoanaerobaculum sp.]|nr:GSU2203 family decaheme c-type cytochrome [Thermoanaerobaculum sp.]